MTKKATRLAAVFMAVMMVILTGRFPAKAAETYEITLYGNGGYCIDDSGKKHDEFPFQVSEGTILTMDENLGDVEWRNADTSLVLVGWQDAAGEEYKMSSSFTVTKDVELYAIWDDLIDESAFASAIADKPDEESSAEESSEDTSAESTVSEESSSEESSVESSSEAANSEAADPEESSTESEPKTSEAQSQAAPPMMLATAPGQTAYTVTVDGNGGYYEDTSGTQQTSTSFSYTPDTDILEASDHLGHVQWQHSDPHKHLAAWTDSSGNSYSVDEMASIDIKQDTTLTAVWEDWYLITFESGSPTAFFDYEGTAVPAMTIQHPTNDTMGYYAGQPDNTDANQVFYGWDWDGDGVSDTFDYYGYEPTGDTTFTAIWADKITITFDPNGGYYDNGNGPETTPYVYEGNSQDWTDSLPAPYIQNQNVSLALTGWAYDKDGQSMVSETPPYRDVNGQTVYQLTYDANGGYFNGDSNKTQAFETIPATQTWKNANSVNSDYQDVMRTGYEFAGWAADPDGNEILSFSNDMTDLHPVLPETGDVTVYAIWRDTSEKTDVTGLWIYKLLNDGSAEIIDYLGSDVDIVIPDTVDGMPVISVEFSNFANGAHNNSLDIESIVMPDSVQRLSMMGLSGRTSLKSVVMGSGITEIPTSMFRDCTALSEVVLPANIQYIRAWAFQGTAITSLDLPESCTQLGWRAFYGCSNLTDVTIRGNLTDFGSEVFVGTALQNITFKADLPTSGIMYETAFEGITANGYYPVSWTSVPASTYQGATNITWIREATVPVMQIDHQTTVPDTIYVDGILLNENQYTATVTQDAEGKDVVVIELTEDFKSTLSDEVVIEALYGTDAFEGTVYPENISYATLSVEGEDQTQTITQKPDGTSSASGLEPIVITVSGEASEVASVAVDGKVLDTSAYTLAPGSTIVTILEDYLVTLSPDVEEHDVTVTFNDGGIAKASFRIVSQTVQEEPEESKAEESQAEESAVEESKAEESSAEESKAEESKVEESKTEESKAEESKAEESKAEESKAEESVVDESKSEESAPVTPSNTPTTGDPGYMIWVIVIAASGVILAALLAFFLKKRRK